MKSRGREHFHNSPLGIFNLVQFSTNSFISGQKKIVTKKHKKLGLPDPPGLRFVATVTTGGRVEFVPGVQIFPENNAISRIIE